MAKVIRNKSWHWCDARQLGFQQLLSSKPANQFLHVSRTFKIWKHQFCNKSSQLFYGKWHWISGNEWLELVWSINVRKVKKPWTYRQFENAFGVETHMPNNSRHTQVIPIPRFRSFYYLRICARCVLRRVPAKVLIGNHILASEVKGISNQASFDPNLRPDKVYSASGPRDATIVWVIVWKFGWWLCEVRLNYGCQWMIN